MTIGPCHATGSLIGVPEIKRNLTPFSPAWTATSSPLSKTTKVLLPVKSLNSISWPLNSFSTFTPIGLEAL